MTKYYTPLIGLLTLASCGTQIKYVGKTSVPTQNVDVFVDASSIKKPYTVVGKGYVRYGVGYNMERLQAKAIEKAKEKGADAVLFQDYFVTEQGTSSYIATKPDTAGRTLVNTHNARAVATSQTDVLFLKYD